MKKIQTTISLDCRKVGFQADIYAKSGDVNAINVLATLTEGTKPIVISEGVMPSHTRAILRAVKPDGTHIYNSAYVDGSVVYCPITAQTIAVPGVVECEIQIIDSDSIEPKVLYSPKFRIIVEDILYTDSGIESTDEYTELTDSVREMDALMTRASEILDNYSEVSATAVESKEVGVDVSINNGVNFSFRIPRGAKGDKPLVEFTLDEEGNLYYEVTYESAE